MRLMTFNIQAGAYTGSYREYLTRSWQTVLPHKGKLRNLAGIAQLIEPCDFVAIQEADSASVRTGFRDQMEYLAEMAGFPFWSHQRNRNLGLAQPGSGLLSRFEPTSVIAHRLPGAIPGRGALEVHFGEDGQDLRLIVVHMALTAAGQLKQSRYLADLTADMKHVAILGDFNATPESDSLAPLFASKRLRSANTEPSFPSWNPSRNIDLVLLSAGLKVKHAEVYSVPISDHLPVQIDVEIPRSCAATLAGLNQT
ncbi:endonuclease [Ahniella affigens]|uniref:Endonuclease n=1 Tax=Ahniella affigens TaxID=2021234 RepID=A0A2P1PMG3_9GAMM|nr:endonuclease/exonuclease/phosphatase family protein [Ahniella affigens]AVP96031.1 endonuclease [Ahniella affigens]